MNNWWFALVVFGFGLLFTIFIDRQRDRSGPPEVRTRRRRWLEYWFTGRYPSKEELESEAKLESEEKLETEKKLETEGKAETEQKAESGEERKRN